MRARVVQVGLIALLAAGVAVGGAYGAQSLDAGSPNSYTACVLNKVGSLRIVATASQCNPKVEQSITLAGPQTPRTVSVRCGAGQTIQSALDAAPVHLPLTVDVTGVCTENVAITRDEVTLNAAAPGAKIVAADADNTALFVTGRNVDVNGLDLQGGISAMAVSGGASVVASRMRVTGAQIDVLVYAGASAQLNDLTIDGSTSIGLQTFGATVLSNSVVSHNPRGGILVQSGYLELYGSTLTDNGFDGLGLIAGGIATVNGTTIQRSDGPGVQAYAQSTVNIGGGTVIQNNTRNGVTAQGGAMAWLTGVSITGNGGGAYALDGARLSIGGASSITDNTGDGVLVQGGSEASVGGNTIIANAGNGVSVHDLSIVSFDEGTNHLTGNSGWGVWCAGPPATAVITGDPGTVTGNAQGQVSCPVAP